MFSKFRHIISANFHVFKSLEVKYEFAKQLHSEQLLILSQRKEYVHGIGILKFENNLKGKKACQDVFQKYRECIVNDMSKVENANDIAQYKSGSSQSGDFR